MMDRLRALVTVENAFGDARRCAGDSGVDGATETGCVAVERTVCDANIRECCY